MDDHSEKTESADTSVKFTQQMFYGRSKSATLPVSIRIKRRLRELSGKHIPTAYKSRLIGPCSSWKIFYRQKDAFDFVTSQSEDLRVWCYESDQFTAQSGQRLFLASSVQQFWHYYSQLPSVQRHHYEVIPEGTSCHLYFDLEYRTDCNPGLQGPRMVDVFIQLFCYHLQRHYGIHCTKEHVLQLDASIPSKFSRHLIFHLENAAFRNNSHAGGFVNHVCSNLEDILHGIEEAPASTHDTAGAAEKAAPSPSAGAGPHTASSTPPPAHQVSNSGLAQSCPTNDCPGQSSRGRPLEAPIQVFLRETGLKLDDIRSLFVKDKQGKQVIFCDRGVYTKNRNFRLYLSCKLGKVNPLVVSKDISRPCAVGDNSRHSPVTSPQQERIFLESLVSIIRPSPNLRLLSWENGDGSNTKSGPSPHTREHKASAEGYCTASPYPEVDGFVTSVVTANSRHGNIRRWSYFQDAEMLIYDIVGNRWCHNIKRQHRSNNIMMVADLQRGVYYQKCHDPDCKAANFKSQDWPLPKEILPSHILDKDDDFPEFTHSTPAGQEDIDSIGDDDLCNINLDDFPGFTRSTPAQQEDMDSIGDDDLRNINLDNFPKFTHSTPARQADMDSIGDDDLRNINLDNFPKFTRSTPAQQADMDYIGDDDLRNINLDIDSLTGSDEGIGSDGISREWEDLPILDEVLVAEAESLMEGTDDAALLAATVAVENQLSNDNAL